MAKRSNLFKMAAKGEFTREFYRVAFIDRFGEVIEIEYDSKAHADRRYAELVLDFERGKIDYASIEKVFEVDGGLGEVGVCIAQVTR